MLWSLQRQLLYALSVIGIFVALIVGVYFLFFYSTPTCFDGKENQDETGVDCGGVCSRMCVAPNVTPLWARSVEATPGVHHAVSLIRNPDAGAQGTISYVVSLFDAENVLIAKKEGKTFLLPGEIFPLFVPNIVVGERVVARTFVDVTPRTWDRAEREIQSVRVLNWSFDEDRTKLTAVVENYGALPVGEVVVTALIFNKEETLIGASQTRIDALDARKRKNAVFTWPTPFPDTTSRIDIIPRVTPR